MFISFVSSAFECGIYLDISHTGRNSFSDSEFGFFFSRVECVDVVVVSRFVVVFIFGWNF